MERETISGNVENIVYAEEEKGFTVARVKQSGKRDLTTVVGALPGLQPGETVICKGFWKHHAKHGRQFCVESFQTKQPTDVVGIQKYLESGLIKGIGPVYAKRIVERFGTKTLDMIDERPECLLDVDGIGEKRVEKIAKCWAEQRSIREVMIFLRSYGVSSSFAQKIFRLYGDRSIQKITDNPYSLAKEIRGIGFKSADAIAQKLGIAPDSPKRIEAGIVHTLWEMSSEGHTCCPKEELIETVAVLLEVDQALVEPLIEEMKKSGELALEENTVWVKPLFLAEKGIVREIERLQGAKCALRDVDLDKALVWVEAKLSLQLAPEQREAVRDALAQKVLIITGGPGTGKSTITKAILTVTDKLSKKILLAAPTGRAAKRMSEICRRKALTIHSMLEMDFSKGGFKRNKDSPLQCDLLIVDEASMIDTQLMYHLLKAIPDTARVIFVGDVDQLPSVGPGNVLRDLIESEKIATQRLKRIFRQAAGSRIITNAHAVNKGYFPKLESEKNSDFHFIECETPEELLLKIVKLVSEQLPKKYHYHRFDDIQVLAPMKKGIIGTENLNFVLQKELNPSLQPLARMGRSFHIGDKVMQIRNNYQKEVYNGDVGKIVGIDLTEGELQVTFDGKLVPYDFSEIDELVLAYAVSIHKYQGSECPCVVIPVHTSHFKLLCRNLLYTGITRGKKLVVLVGTKKAVAIAVRNDEVLKRHTRLQELMRKGATAELSLF